MREVNHSMAYISETNALEKWYGWRAVDQHSGIETQHTCILYTYSIHNNAWYIFIQTYMLVNSEYIYKSVSIVQSTILFVRLHKYIVTESNLNLYCTLIGRDY